MIKKLTTKNFRKLTDHTFDFTGGLNAILAPNEAGKSTLLEAIAYAMFGIKACREEIAKVVTWGQAEKTLKVELVLEIDGVEYTIKRGKSGAEVNYGEDGKVVGQGEVSTFVANLLGANVDSAGRLMIAKQGAIRGALDAGAAKTMELIEDLADFGVIDRVVDLIQSNCVTGPTQVAEDRVGRAQQALTDTKAAVVAVDPEASKAKVAELQALIVSRQAQIAVWEPEFKASEEAVRAAQVAKQSRDSLKSQLASAQNNHLVHRQQLKDAQQAACAGPDPSTVSNLRGEVNNAEKHARTFLAWQGLQALVYPEAFWEGNRAGLDAELARETGYAKDKAAERGQLLADNRVLEAKRITGSVCGFCKQDTSQFPEVAATNAQIEADLAKNLARISVLEGQVREHSNNVADLQGVLKLSKPFEAYAAKYAEYVRVEDTDVPPRLFWVGTPPGDVNAAGLRLQLQALERQQDAATKAAARVEALTTTLTEDEARIGQLQAEIEKCAVADSLPQLRETHEAVAAQYNQRVNDVTEFKFELSQVEHKQAAALQAYERQMHEVAKAEKALEDAERELKAQEFNNALIKRIRLARPKIADKLWTIVLSSVSGYFSQMRSQQSVVTREANDFRVDGQSIGGLSGSTLDILGLAIRLALTRTFLPTVPFLILDEPAAAMDEERTNATLGFLVAAGFKQTLLVTHDATSETVANNLVTLQ
jgi:DNA repair exonuclease SbcCD ATPase subunit